MGFFSKLLRFIFFSYKDFCSFLRVVKLRLLYPGIKIVGKTTIERNCDIKCIKGSRIFISNSTIYAGTQILADENSLISIEDTYIGRNCTIVSKKRIVIKKGCLIAEMVVIRDQNHVVDVVQENAREKFDVAPILINENVWLASKSTVLKGVTIGNYSVVAASAVVTQSIPMAQMWGGIPARFIKQVKAPGYKLARVSG